MISGSKLRGSTKIFAYFVVLLTISFGVILSSCGKEKVIIKYREVPPSVVLIAPPNDSLIYDNNPTFIWHPASSAVRYHLQVSAASDFVNKSIDVEITDTTYTTISSLANGSFYWRVRGMNQDNAWGDWSDADIWIFYKTDNVYYIPFLGSVHTVGTARDVTVRGNTAFVADGAAELTMVDVSNKNSPTLIKNIDTIGDDFAVSVHAE